MADTRDAVISWIVQPTSDPAVTSPATPSGGGVLAPWLLGGDLPTANSTDDTNCQPPAGKLRRLGSSGADRRVTDGQVSGASEHSSQQISAGDGGRASIPAHCHADSRSTVSATVAATVAATDADRVEDDQVQRRDTIISDLTFNSDSDRDSDVASPAAVQEEEEDVASGVCCVEPVDSDTALLVLTSRVHVWGSCGVRVVAGSVCIHGARLTPHTHCGFTALHALALRALPCIETDANTPSSLTPAEACERVLSCCRCDDGQLPRGVTRALNNVPVGGAALLLRRHDSSSGLDRLLSRLAAWHAGLFWPPPLPPLHQHETDTAVQSVYSRLVMKHVGCVLACNQRQLARLPVLPFIIDHHWLRVSAQLTDLAQQESVRVVLAGGKGVGKSSLMQHLVNQMLSDQQSSSSSSSSLSSLVAGVHVLDLDPGQTEFGVCACVSLVLVDCFLLGPAFTHLTRPLRSVYIGVVNVADNPARYLQGVADLLQYLTQHAAQHHATPLIVNTMGWASGLGEEIFAEVVRLVRPTDVVEVLHATKETFNFSYRLRAELLQAQPRGIMLHNCVPTTHADKETLGSRAAGPLSQNELDYRYYQLTSQRPRSDTVRPRSGVSPKFLRNLCTTASLAELLYASPQCHQTKPIRIPWCRLAIELSGSEGCHVLPQHLMAAIVGVPVVLCRSQTELWRVQEPWPSLLSSHHQHVLCECLGVGVVRGYDEHERCLYLSTDMSEQHLASLGVNTLARGPLHLLSSSATASSQRPAGTTALDACGNNRVRRQPCRRADDWRPAQQYSLHW